MGWTVNTRDQVERTLFITDEHIGGTYHSPEFHSAGLLFFKECIRVMESEKSILPTKLLIDLIGPEDTYQYLVPVARALSRVWMAL